MPAQTYRALTALEKHQCFWIYEKHLAQSPAKESKTISALPATAVASKTKTSGYRSISQVSSALDQHVVDHFKIID